MKRLIFYSFALIALTLMLSAGWTYKEDFLTVGVSCAHSETLVNATGFISIHVTSGRSPAGTLTITFTRTTGTASTVDFQFQGSFDGGTTWTTSYFVHIAIATNTTAVSNVVRDSTLINLNGISHLRLYQIVNGDASTDLTLCNATLSY